MTSTFSFTSARVGQQLTTVEGDSLAYSVSGTFSGTVVLQRSDSGGGGWSTVQAFTGSDSGTITVAVTPGQRNALYRFICTAYVSGTIVTSLADTAAVSASGGGTPGGDDTQVQFNDSAAFGGDAGLTYDKASDTLTAGNLVVSGAAFPANIAQIGRSGTNGLVEIAAESGDFATYTPLLSVDASSNNGSTDGSILAITGNATVPSGGTAMNTITGVAGSARNEGAASTLYGVSAVAQPGANVSEADAVIAGVSAFGGTTALATVVNADIFANGASTVITDARGVYVQSAAVASGATITTNYGIKVDDQTAGGTNYAIKTGLGLVSVGDAIEGAEQSAPSAPASNGYRLFARDNGSGKTQLCVLFATGAVQVIATQP